MKLVMDLFSSLMVIGGSLLVSSQGKDFKMKIMLICGLVLVVIGTNLKFYPHKKRARS